MFLLKPQQGRLLDHRFLFHPPKGPCFRAEGNVLCNRFVKQLIFGTENHTYSKTVFS